jgi:hypothetical protein
VEIVFQKHAVPRQLGAGDLSIVAERYLFVRGVGAASGEGGWERGALVCGAAQLADANTSLLA